MKFTETIESLKIEPPQESLPSRDDINPSPTRQRGAIPERTPRPSATADAGDFDRAIGTLSTRVARLFGLKAGLSAGYSSAVMISDDGLAVTVLSLLLDADRLRAVTPDGITYAADIVGTDKERMLALLRLKPMPRYNRRGMRVDPPAIEPGRFDYFPPGDSATLHPGDWVVIGANPFKVSQGDEPISVTMGVFSTRTELDARRKTRDVPYRGEVLVIDAVTSNPGSPGGALVDVDGQWMGIIGRMVVSKRTHTNLNYAIPVEIVMDFVNSVLHPQEKTDAQSDPTTKPYHGIKLFELAYQKKLVYVDSVRRGSPARRAGVKKDDLIVSVNGRSVNDIQGFNRSMNAKKPGDQVQLVVIRGEQLHNVTLLLEAAP